MNEKPIILFDGNCSFCLQSMLFIQRKQKTNSFLFISVWTEEGKQLLKKYQIENVDSVVLIKDANVFIYSTAILRICGELIFPLPLMKLFFIVPVFIRDTIYKGFASNRYRWFGRKNECEIIPGNKMD